MTEEEISDALLRMRKIANDASGWNTLYQDVATDEFWEVTYPQSAMHGGGPRDLRRVTVGSARSSYRLDEPC